MSAGAATTGAASRVALAIAAAAAAVFVVLGITCLFRPGAVEFVDITPNTSTAASDIRAVYGGLSLAIGVYALQFVIRRRTRAAALFLGSAYTGLAGGRLFGVLVDGQPTLTTLSLLAVEAVAAGACAWAAWQAGAKQPH